MSKFDFVPRNPDPDAQGYLIKIMGLSYIMTKKEYEPVTVYSRKIYSSEKNVLNSFSHSWPYFCSCEKQIVCCVYDPQCNYKFSFVRDQESGKITKIKEPSHKLPEHMLYYDHKFIPGQARYPLSTDDLEETRKALSKSKTKAKKTDKVKQ
jgi:hypothetical protein